MKQTDARTLFPKHTLRFSEGNCAVYEKGTSNLEANVMQHEDKVVVGVMWLGSLKTGKVPPGSVPRLIAIAEIGSYRNVYEVEQALNAERQFDQKGPATHEMAVKQFRKAQEQDFDHGIQLLAALVAALEDNSKGFPRQQYQCLNTNGRAMYKGPILEAPVTSPVTQVAQTLREGKAKRAERDKRTVWGAEDDEIFALVEHDHKVLSDRLAALHSARGSKISIPEFDRRRKAQQENQYG